MDLDREGHLHGVRFDLGEGFHADDSVALLDRLDAPVHASFAVRFDLDGLFRFAHRFEALAVNFEDRLDVLRVLKVVVDVGREDDLVLLDEEPGRLKPQ